MQKGSIRVQTENIFPIIKKFLYSDHEIFIRELVSNAIDATQKLKTLSSIGEAKGEILKVGTESDYSVLSDAELEGMHKWNPSDENLPNWVAFFEKYGVYFSSPLDLDFMMQIAFPDEYKATGDRGPLIPKSDDPNRAAKIQEAIIAVLKEGSSAATYSEAEQLAFFWYRYLFLGRGKPSTHIMALAAIDVARLRAGCPEVLKRLVTAMKRKLRHAPPPPPQPPAPAKEAADAAED